MMRRLMFFSVLCVLLPMTSAATPVSISVEPWRSIDGSFGFSVIHAAKEGQIERAGMEFYAGGSIEYEFSGPTQFMRGDLVGSVLNISVNSLQLDSGSVFNVQSSVLDFGVASGIRRH